ncbi:MFS myo-inositol transporter [Sphaerulina musiva SO2202]|uniref:MFS myo-inositol transporter n=1 Tax=Sphaerulina musiva (strain SO2202) TaxID=692275 RepID=M3ARX1_SPHMS|nr:MFS myo-inositol transporter [Sphaerulina musiva SO2202]EMF08249.1 MFS myo-inositol transporter [Sphaerulina musiva SO2202]
MVADDDDTATITAASSPPPPPRRPAQLSVRSAGPVIRFLTLSAGISGLLFGFDTGVISSTLVSLGSDLSNRPLTTSDKSIVTAITSLFALLSAPTTGFFADRYGRKSVIVVPAMLFALGAVIQAGANYVWIMAAGRALVGAAVGVASGAVPLYITELAPAELRGRLVTIQSLFITGGQVVAYLIGWAFAALPHGWRYMVGVGAVPALLQLALLLWMPETPRWLLQTGQQERARAVLQAVYATLASSERDSMVDYVLAGIHAEILEEDKTLQGVSTSSDGTSGFRNASKELFATPANRRALTIACMLQGLQQLCGFNSLMYFSATIFSLVGFTSPIGTSLSIALTNFVFTLVAFALIDSVGRRKMLLRTIPFMVLGLLACSVAFMFIPPSQSHLTSNPDGMRNASGTWSIVLLLSLILYVAAYASGLGTVPWQQSELFPLRVRSLGSGLATTTNWSSNFVIGMTFLPMMNILGASTTFTLYAIISVLGWATIWTIYPETAGLELEGIGEILRDGWGVTESIHGFRERQREAWEREHGG